jgi:hypothetical protein
LFETRFPPATMGRFRDAHKNIARRDGKARGR